MLPSFFDSVVSLIVRTSTDLPPDVRSAMKAAIAQEPADTQSGQALTIIAQNIDLAADCEGAICQDTGMLDQLTTEQNLALPLSLHIESMPGDVRQRVRALAEEVELSPVELGSKVGSLAPLSRQRLRLGRALALNPRVVLAEHPNAPLSRADTLAFANVFRQVVSRRRIAALVLTADAEFAGTISPTVLALQPATGLLKRPSGWRSWLR